MYAQDTFKIWAKNLLKNPVFQQLLPFLVLFLFPLILLTCVTRLRKSSQALYTLSHKSTMVFESLFPWVWSGGSNSDGSAGAAEDSSPRKKEKKAVRTRAGQIAQSSGDGKRSHDEDDNYPGLVNISGTYCFMNSTLQAMASLDYLKPHIDAIHSKAEALDVPTPVIDALKELLEALNTPKSSASSIRPTNIIQAFTSHNNSSSSTPSPSARTLFSSREHQDAQELFQLLSECIKAEASAVDKEGSRDRGLAGALGGAAAEEGSSNGHPVLGLGNEGSSSGGTSSGVGGIGSGGPSSGGGLARSNVFDGLTANRRSCMQCGYTEAVMHFAFDSWQLAVPRTSSIALEDCLADYTRLELLTDCICRKCSLLATHKRLVQESEKLSEAISPSSPTKKEFLSSSLGSLPNGNGHRSMPNGNGHVNGGAHSVSASKKKRAREVRKLEARVKAALEEGRVEDDLKDVRIEKVVSPMSTKQAMIARPPPVLALHINRSMHFGQYAAKNPVRVIFPEWLDLTPFTTSGSLSTKPSAPISSPLPSTSLSSSLGSSRSSSPFFMKEAPQTKSEEQERRSTTPTPADQVQRTIYRLMAVVCHFGQHSYGHYICYRRKPSSTISSIADSASSLPPNDGVPIGSSTNPGEGWLRISDSSVKEVGIETVLAEGGGAFMLYYERISPAHHYGGGGSSSSRGSSIKSPSPAGSLTSSAFYPFSPGSSSIMAGSASLSSSPSSLYNSTTLASSIKGPLSRSVGSLSKSTTRSSSISLVGGGSLIIEQPSSDSEFEMDFDNGGGGSKGNGTVYAQGDRSPSEETLRPSVVGVNENGGAVGIGVCDGHGANGQLKANGRHPLEGNSDGMAISNGDLKGKSKESTPGFGGAGRLSVGARVIRSVAAGLSSERKRTISTMTNGNGASVTSILEKANGSTNGIGNGNGHVVGNGNGHAPPARKIKVNGHPP